MHFPERDDIVITPPHERQHKMREIVPDRNEKGKASLPEPPLPIVQLFPPLPLSMIDPSFLLEKSRFIRTT